MSRDFLGTGWKFPIRVNPTGGLSWSSDEHDIQEAIWIILATAPGERQMRPRFGCGIHNSVFAPNEPKTHGTIATQVRKALTEFERRIDLVDVRVEAAPDEPNKLLIRVDYRIRTTNAFHNLVYPFYIQEGSGG
jgi:phage baseplate assembly protein W